MELKTICLAGAVLFLASCASYRPVLDENPHYEKVGEEQAEHDINVCMKRADRYLAKHKEEAMQKEMGRNTAVGAAIGGGVGLMSGGTIGSTAVGAAVGAVAGAGGTFLSKKAEDNIKPDHLKQRYVTLCLERKDYGVIGWK